MYVLKRIKELFPDIKVIKLSDQIIDKVADILNIINQQQDLEISFYYIKYIPDKNVTWSEISDSYNIDLLPQIINNSVNEIVFAVKDYIYTHCMYKFYNNKHILQLKYIYFNGWTLIYPDNTLITSNLHSINEIIRQLTKELLKYKILTLVTEALTDEQKKSIHQIINKIFKS